MPQKLTVTRSLEARVTSAILAVLSIASIFIMLHHPSVSSENAIEQIKEMNHESKANTYVHGILITFIMLINMCLSYYGKARGLNRSSVLYGLIVYWVGTVVMVLAALLSGIIAPRLAAHYLHANINQADVFSGIYLLTSEMNLAFAYFSIFCWCTGMCLWAFDMLRQTNIIKFFGFFSLLAAFTIIASLLSGWITLSVFGTTIILVVISSWQLGIACSLYFENLSTSQVDSS